MRELYRPSPEEELINFQAILKENLEKGLISIYTANEAERKFMIERGWTAEDEADHEISNIGAM